MVSGDPIWTSDSSIKRLRGKITWKRRRSARTSHRLGPAPPLVGRAGDRKLFLAHVVPHVQLLAFGLEVLRPAIVLIEQHHRLLFRRKALDEAHQDLVRSAHRPLLVALDIEDPPSQPSFRHRESLTASRLPNLVPTTCKRPGQGMHRGKGAHDAEADNLGGAG